MHSNSRATLKKFLVNTFFVDPDRSTLQGAAHAHPPGLCLPAWSTPCPAFSLCPNWRSSQSYSPAEANRPNLRDLCQFVL
jgi:hypothetical protein